MKKFSLISVFNNRGFTLLEILIAITLLAFISLGVINIVENAVLTKERTTEVNRNNLQAETAMSRFEWDFSQIYSPLYFSTVLKINANAADGTAGAATTITPQTQNYYEQLVQRFEKNEHFMAVSKEGIPVPRFYSPEKNTFEFFTSSNRRKIENTKQSHFAWVKYTLADQEKKIDDDEGPNIPPGLKSLVRYYAPDDPYNEKRIDIEDVRVKGAVLLENVESLEFHFWDFNRKKWETSLKTIPGGESLVRGVKVIITWYDSTANKRTLTRIFRSHWPMVVPVDPAPAVAPGAATAGAAAGGATTTGSEGDDPDPDASVDD